MTGRYLVVALFCLVGVAGALAREAGDGPGPEIRALQVLAAKGDREALYHLAQVSERGDGLPVNLREAVRLYCRAAERGSGEAAFRLSNLFLVGSGVNVNVSLSNGWMAEAARRGHAEARRMIRGLELIYNRAPRPGCNRARWRQPFTSFPPSRLPGQPAPAPEAIARMVRMMAPSYGLDPDLVLAVIRAESNFKVDAVSPKRAQGLMQLIPETADRFGVDAVFDPQENLRGGMSYLRWLLAHFEGDVRLTLAGYNAGEGAVDRFGGVPPYTETINYVSRVMSSYPSSWHAYDPTVAPRSRMLHR